MFIFDDETQRLINLDQITHMQCKERTDPRTNLPLYLIEYKMNESVPNEDTEMYDQLILISKFDKEEDRNNAFCKVIKYLIHTNQLIALREL